MMIGHPLNIDDTSNPKAVLVLRVVQYGYPLSLVLYYAFASMINVCVNPQEKPDPSLRNRLHKAALILTLGVLGCHFAEAIALLVANFTVARYPSQDAIIGTVMSTFAWFILSAGFTDAPNPINFPFTGSWVIGFGMEASLFGLTTAFDTEQSDSLKYTRIALQLSRLCGLGVLAGLAFSLVWPGRKQEAGSDESEPLLVAKIDSKDPQYGATKVSQAHDVERASVDDANEEADATEEDEDDDDDGAYGLRNKRLPKGSWWTYAKGFALFFPIAWPRGQKGNEARLVGCGVSLLAVRVFNILSPRQTGIMIDTLADSDSSTASWIKPMLLVTIFTWLNSSSGFPWLRVYLWTPLEASLGARLRTFSYKHIMELSSDFHDSKSSGRLWYTIFAGYSVTGFLEMVMFDLLPIIFDFVLGAFYIAFALDPYLALLVFGTSIVYLWSTTKIVSRLNVIRRSSREAHKSEYQVLTETMTNWKTVSYFNRLPHEEARYSSSVLNVRGTVILVRFWRNIESAIKATILEIGLLLMMLRAGYVIVHGAPVGNMVVLLQLWAQIRFPLSVIASSIDRVAENLVDAEDLLKILQKQPSIQDDKDAKPLELKQGEVEFESVGFSYDKKRDILKDVSFRATPGQTIALVGETGGGKSTILKLLFRFYDVTTGSVKIDGQDIRNVTLRSLRHAIGNVPQDPAMFNDTIMNNLRYAKIDATDEEVHEACKAAAIHDKINTFTKGYEAKVGEGGTKLSGGELQRLAIARAILQNPQIVLLDEATSSVDTETESHIQESLKKLTSGRTTFVIAHRLSTIVNADLILVVRKGEIVERGPHKKLMEINGQYHRLWTKQMFPTDTERDEGVKAGSDYLNDLPDFDSSSKVRKSTRDSGGEESQDASVTSSAGSDAPPRANQSGSEETKFGRNSKEAGLANTLWRPDAPEFIPQRLREQNKSQDWSDAISVTSAVSKGKEKQKPSWEQETAGASCQKHGHGHTLQEKAKKIYQSYSHPHGGQVDGSGKETLPVEISHPAATEGQDTPSTVSHQILPRGRKRYSNRRQQSKSEPAGQGQTDGTEDTEEAISILPEDSGEGPRALKSAMRRVSAPSDPQHQPTDESKKPSTRRRRRYFRKRNMRQSSSGASKTSSSMTSPKFNSPTAPPTSPAQGVELSGNSTGGVRFAPGS